MFITNRGTALGKGDEIQRFCLGTPVGSFIDDSATVGAGFRVTWRWGFF